MDGSALSLLGTWPSLVLIEDLLCVRCPGASDRVPMSEHPGRCPSVYVRASERRCRASGSVSERLCPSIRAPMSSIRAPMSSIRAPMSSIRASGSVSERLSMSTFSWFVDTLLGRIRNSVEKVGRRYEGNDEGNRETNGYASDKVRRWWNGKDVSMVRLEQAMERLSRWLEETLGSTKLVRVSDSRDESAESKL
ncbi:unnamed protein product [Cochlearia groenlandica]